MSVLRWLARLWQADDVVSDACLRHYALAEGRQGWTDGPVWRTPRELRQRARAERRERVVGRR